MTEAYDMQSTARVLIVMGSQSDYSTLINSEEVLQNFGVKSDVRIVSAHRTPQRLYDVASTAKDKGFRVIIAGAGGAAHLPGMVASLTTLPVLGVPVESKALNGIDSLLSIVQMPAGVPVGTLAIGKAGARNAAILAISILALSDNDLAVKLAEWRKGQTESVAEQPEKLEKH